MLQSRLLLLLLMLLVILSTASCCDTDSPPPISFSLGGARVGLATYNCSTSKTRLDKTRVITTTVYTQFAVTGGLQAEVESTTYTYESYGTQSGGAQSGGAAAAASAEEVLLRFRNGGAEATPLLCDAATLDRTWLLPSSARAVLHRNSGSFAQPDDYMPFTQDLPVGTNISVLPLMGFSSNHVLPFFALDLGGLGGVVLSLGWSGNWQLNITRTSSGLRLTAAVGDLCTAVAPGESFRLVRVLVVPVAPNGTLRDAMNLHKRILFDYKIPRKASDGTVQGALTASWTWGGWNPADLSEANQLQHVEWVNLIGADAWWLDAGWFNGQPQQQ
jgi:hypothetical protein